MKRDTLNASCETLDVSRILFLILAHIVQVVRVIREENLLDLVTETGHVMMNGLEDIASRHQGIITKLRGRGTFIAFDLPTVQQRDKFLNDLRQVGVNLGGCGTSSVRIRPALNCAPRHAHIMLDKILQVMAKFN